MMLQASRWVAEHNELILSSVQTNVENMLDAWVAKDLPELSIEVARKYSASAVTVHLRANRTLLQEFMRAVDFEDPDKIYDNVKKAVQVVQSHPVSYFDTHCRTVLLRRSSGIRAQ